MDTQAGGENSQYESIKTVTNPHSKQGGQMGEEETEVDSVSSQQQQQKVHRGEKTAENVRYGQKISEEGMGGRTTEAGGNADQDGFGTTDAQEGIDSAEDSRQEQGYGSGSGVGA